MGQRKQMCVQYNTTIVINTPSIFVVLISQNDRGQFKDLFAPEYWRTTLLLWFIWLA